jgi:hypothetical protein
MPKQTAPTPEVGIPPPTPGANGDPQADIMEMAKSFLGPQAAARLQAFQNDDTAFKSWVMETLTAIGGAINTLNEKVEAVRLAVTPRPTPP